MEAAFWYGMFVLCGVIALVGVVSAFDLNGAIGTCVAAGCAVAYLRMGDEARYF